MQNVKIRIKGLRQTLETSGFAGGECLAVTDGIRRRTGGRVTSETATDEQFEAPSRELESV